MAVNELISQVYDLGQTTLDTIFSFTPPPPKQQLTRPRIAIIGAGYTGISAAAHCIGHGFDVRIFEARGPQHLGGIWTRVNKTSSLQVDSLLYGFHPKVNWREDYTAGDQIVHEIRKMWFDHMLEQKTLFYTPVLRMDKGVDGLWRINGSDDLVFEGIIAAVGTCGDISAPYLPYEHEFYGEILHSSHLDGKKVMGKKIIVAGGGPSAVEAIEYCLDQGATDVKVLSRTEKWIVPRNVVVAALLSFSIFSQETLLSFIPETLQRRLFHRDLSDVPSQGSKLFNSTPMIKGDSLLQIKHGRVEWLRGDIQEVVRDGVKFVSRRPGVLKGGPGTEETIGADIIIKATGFHRPSLKFIPKHCFTAPYGPPAWLLQSFPLNELTICANNCLHVNPVGLMGNYHVAIYTRSLLVFLIDPTTRPGPKMLKLWIGITSFLKSLSPLGTFEPFNYLELVFWVVFCIAYNPFKWKLAMFVLFGVGELLSPMDVKGDGKLEAGMTGW